MYMYIYIISYWSVVQHQRHPSTLHHFCYSLASTNSHSHYYPLPHPSAPQPTPREKPPSTPLVSQLNCLSKNVPQ